jgi:hypothetical protein
VLISCNCKKIPWNDVTICGQARVRVFGKK